jgi:hypothetical protein
MMSVYQVAGSSITITGNGVTNNAEITAASVHNPITGAGGPVTVRITNSSTTATATVGWVASASAPTYSFPGLAGTASGSGQNQEFTVVVSKTGYSVTMTNAGDSFIPTETITILGTDVGGATTANDIVITVATAGDLNTVSALDDTTLVPGTGYSDATGVATLASIAGVGLTVDITTTAGAIDTVAINDPGSGYAAGEVITITGGNGDATIDVLTVDAGGAILTYTVAGTAVWPQSALTGTTYVSPMSSAFVQVGQQLGVDTTFTGNSASGNMYITPVNVVM